jgi:hypothetical protein
MLTQTAEDVPSLENVEITVEIENGWALRGAVNCSRSVGGTG